MVPNSTHVHDDGCTDDILNDNVGSPRPGIGAGITAGQPGHVRDGDYGWDDAIPHLVSDESSTSVTETMDICMSESRHTKHNASTSQFAGHPRLEDGSARPSKRLRGEHCAHAQCGEPTGHQNAHAFARLVSDVARHSHWRRATPSAGLKRRHEAACVHS